MARTGIRIHLIVQVKPAGRPVFEYVEHRVIGVNADPVGPGVEDHVAQPRFTTVMQSLVVAQELVYLIAMISCIRSNGFPGVMATENHENILVFPDELLPRLLPVVSLRLHAPIRLSRPVRPHVSVCQDHDAVPGVPRHYLIGPYQHFVAGLTLERNDKKFHPGLLEMIP